jgi:predicted RNA polymerase sigma factor
MTKVTCDSARRGGEAIGDMPAQHRCGGTIVGDPVWLKTHRSRFPGAIDAAGIGEVFRENAGRSVAAVIRAFGEIDLAEDAVQEAFAVALRRWSTDGLPPNPGGWITTTARNRALDRLRRKSGERQLAAQLPEPESAVDGQEEDEEEELVRDDRLRLIFTCCHPAYRAHAPTARWSLNRGGRACVSRP